MGDERDRNNMSDDDRHPNRRDNNNDNNNNNRNNNDDNNNNYNNDTMRRAVNIIFDSFWSSALSADDNGQLRRREIDANQDLNTVKYIKLYSSFLFPYLT